MRQAQPGAALDAALAIENGGKMSVIQDRVRDFATPFGYDRFILFSASTAAKEEVVERMYWVEGDWFETGDEVDALTYLRHCPITRHILEVNEPFFWTKTKGETGEFYRVVSLPRGPGVHGLQIPVFGPLGLEGGMSFGGLRVDASPQARLSLALVGVSAFRSARRLLEPPVAEVPEKLSKREREILAWITAGRRQADIAATLGLSERTVENHLRRIRIRLGVATTAQAIRVAIKIGEIEA